jgi:tetratricopeptide (TPR) repeat protein
MLNKILSLLGGARPRPRVAAAESGKAGRPVDVVDAARELACADALARVDAALEHAPADPALLAARASILRRWGRVHEAFALAADLATAHPASSEAHSQWGFAALQLGRLDVAERAMTLALRAAPEAYESTFNLAYVHYAAGHRPEAQRLYGECVRRRPDDFEALLGFGTCHLDAKDFAAAEATFRRCTEVKPDAAAGWSHLGICLARQGRAAEARAYLETGLARFDATGDHPESFVNLGIFLRDGGDVVESLRVFERYLPGNPDPFAHYAYSHALQMAGHVEEAWEQYEFRWMIEPLQSMRVPGAGPPWEGQPLAGRTIVVREEQGVGDAIQCVRYCVDLKAAGATVMLATTPSFQPLASWCDGVDRVLAPGDATPPYDWWANMMSLPRILGDASRRSPMARPYINVRNDFRERWARRLATASGLKVGLVWGGSPSHANDRYRSVPLQRLAPLMDVDGVTFYALQKGPHAVELDEVAFRERVEPLGDELADFRDAAAAIEQLDLVITVDTSIAHLAGALARDVWMLTARPPDSRWLAEGDRTDWYPTLTLYRQHAWNEWREPVERVARDLRARVAARGKAAPAATPLHIEGGTPPARAERARPAGLAQVAETSVGLVQYRPEGSSRAMPAPLQRAFEFISTLRPLLSQAGGPVLASPAGGSLAALALLHGQPATAHVMLHEPDPIEHAILGHCLVANRLTGYSLLKESNVSGHAPDAAASAPTSILDIDALRLTALGWLVLTDGTRSDATLDAAAKTLWALRPRIAARCRDEDDAMRLAAALDRFAYRCWAGSPPRGTITDDGRGMAEWTLVAVPEDGDPPSMPAWLSMRSPAIA